MKKTILLRGTATGIIAAALVWVIAIKGLGKVYYIAALLPTASFFFLIVAWFLHLREDGFFNTPTRQRDLHPIDDCQTAAPEDGHHSGAPSGDPPADPPLSLFAPRDGMVARSGEPEEPRRTANGGTAGPALLVAAVELAILSAALYLVSGTGASYFR